MKIIGIIAEYNPFHNGHLYQINKIKELYPDSIIITIISSSFSQRGEPIIIDKWERTNILLENNVDLVVELPYPFSTQSADTFAKGGVEILNYLKIDYLAFGVESDNVNELKIAAEIQLNNKNFDIKVKEYLDKKYNYRYSVSKAIYDLTGIMVDTPNDILAVSYIKEILNQNTGIDILPIKRTNNYLDLTRSDKIISASNIRNKLYNNIDIKNFVPLNTYNILKNKVFNDGTLFNLVKYKLLLNDHVNIYCTVDEGIENRLKKYVKTSKNLDELINYVKTKRYTSNKIRRSILHIITEFTKNNSEKLKNIDYIRILGFNIKGKEYINKLKKEIKKTILSNYKKGFEMFELEIKVSSIYDIIMNKDTSIKEYTNKPIIKKDAY